MLDENLPTFYLRSSNDRVKHHATIHLSHQGSDATPVYSIRHPDPSTPDSRNRYAVALYDTYNPDILYGEVLLIPNWTQSTLGAEDIRHNGGLPIPPQPVLPSEFVIQLYNPDQQVHIRWHGGGWNSSGSWGFEMPQQSFRQPSTSAIDRIQSDPTASETTTKLGFRWKKDGKFSRDYICTLSGKSTNSDGSKRKHKEPDITLAIFRQFKEITIYEPNLSRVEIEDLKGLEVVLLLGAIVIREVFNGPIREAFNIGDTIPNGPLLTPNSGSGQTVIPKPVTLPGTTTSQSPPAASQVAARPPPTDPRTQWELDMETARLKKEVEREEKERKKREAAEARRVRKMLEEEERRKREQQREVDRETERLRKIYGTQPNINSTKPPPVQLTRPASAAPQLTGWAYSPQQPVPQSTDGHLVPANFQHAPTVNSNHHNPIPRPYSTATPYIASNLLAAPMHQQHIIHQPHQQAVPGTYGGSGGSHAGAQQARRKSSFWHFGTSSQGREADGRLRKQRSSIS